MNKVTAIVVAATILLVGTADAQVCPDEEAACSALDECRAIMWSRIGGCHLPGQIPQDSAECEADRTADGLEYTGTCSGDASCVFTAPATDDEYQANMLAHTEGNAFFSCVQALRACPNDPDREKDPVIGACRGDEACWSIFTSDAMQRDANDQVTQDQVYDSGWCVKSCPISCQPATVDLDELILKP